VYQLVDKFCEHCGRPLVLHNDRDIRRKRFCSRSCMTLSILPHKGIVNSEEAKCKMRKPHRITAKLLRAQRLRGLKLRGANNWNWKGGISGATRLRTGRADWRELATTIRERDGNKCRSCGRADVKLYVHHVIPHVLTQDDSPKNLITLCFRCHMREESKERDFIRWLIEQEEVRNPTKVR